MLRPFVLSLALASCTHDTGTTALELPASEEKTPASPEDQAAGMQVRSDEPTAVKTEKKKCRPRAERGNASQPAPQIEVGIAKPVGDGNAKPHAYTRFEDCQE